MPPKIQIQILKITFLQENRFHKIVWNYKTQFKMTNFYKGDSCQTSSVKKRVNKNLKVVSFKDFFKFKYAKPSTIVSMTCFQSI